MKRTLIYGLIVAALAVVSCNKTEMDPLTGVFPDATVVELTTLTSCEAVKDDADRRVFTLDLTDGTTPMHMTLIGSKYYLTANQYTEAIDAVAKNGNFVLGKTSIGGKAVKQGYITVSILEEKETENGCENTYSISTVLFLEDGTPYKTFWTGKLPFEKDAVLAPQYTYTDTVAQDCTLEDGSTPVTDVESHTLVLNDLSGTFAAQIKLIRSLGTKDLSGNYTVKEYAHEDLSAGNGFDMGVYFGMDPGAFVIGSYYVADGAVVIIDPGANISVTGMGDGVYSIEGDGFSFLCAPEGYVPGGATVYDATDTVAQDCTLEDGQTLVEDVESHTIVLKDSEGAVKGQIKLIRSVGTTDLAGTYTVKEYAHEDLTAGNGFDLGAMFGMDPGALVIGSYYIGEEGAIVLVQPGETITVSKDGDVYTFEGSTDWVLKGKLVEDTPGPGPDPQPGDAEEVTFTKFLSLSSYVGMGVNLAGINLATSDITYTPADWAAGIYTDSYGGSGKMLKLEYYTTDGTLAPGTYKACAVGGTVGEGEFGIGYDGQWGASGTTLYTITDGKPDAGKYITDGTLTVSVSGEIYTIELESTLLKAKFVGRLSNEPAQAVELTQFLSLTSYTAYGVNLAGVNLATSGITYTPADWAAGIYADSYAGSGNMLKLEYYTTDGSLAPGTYKACAVGGTVGEGEFGIGYDGQWGASGTTWYTITDGTPDAGVYVTDGTLTVSVEGGVYTIVLESSTVNAKFVGKLSNEPDPAPAAVTINIDGDKLCVTGTM